MQINATECLVFAESYLNSKWYLQPPCIDYHYENARFTNLSQKTHASVLKELA